MTAVAFLQLFDLSFHLIKSSIRFVSLYCVLYWLCHLALQLLDSLRQSLNLHIIPALLILQQLVKLLALFAAVLLAQAPGSLASLVSLPRPGLDLIAPFLLLEFLRFGSFSLLQLVHRVPVPAEPLLLTLHLLHSPTQLLTIAPRSFKLPAQIAYLLFLFSYDIVFVFQEVV